MIHLFCGDCFNIMDQLIADGVKIDCIIADLPYGKTRASWDKPLDIPSMWIRIEKIIRTNRVPILLFGQEPFSSQLRLSNSNYKYDWIWRKNKSTGFLNSSHQPLRIHETISVFYVGKCKYYPQKSQNHSPVHKYTKHSSDGELLGKTKLGISGGGSTERFPQTVLEFSVVNQIQKLHPSQKPVELLKYLISTYTDIEDTVLDFTMGVGSTGVAARQLSRNFIGIDVSPKYVDVAFDRIEKGL